MGGRDEAAACLAVFRCWRGWLVCGFHGRLGFQGVGDWAPGPFRGKVVDGWALWRLVGDGSDPVQRPGDMVYCATCADDWEEINVELRLRLGYVVCG